LKNSKNSTRAEDSGEWLFTLRRKGFEEVLEERMKTAKQ